MPRTEEQHLTDLFGSNDAATNRKILSIFNPAGAGGDSALDGALGFFVYGTSKDGNDRTVIKETFATYIKALAQHHKHSAYDNRRIDSSGLTLGTHTKALEELHAQTVAQLNGKLAAGVAASKELASKLQTATDEATVAVRALADLEARGELIGAEYSHMTDQLANAQAEVRHVRGQLLDVGRANTASQAQTAQLAQEVADATDRLADVNEKAQALQAKVDGFDALDPTTLRNMAGVREREAADARKRIRVVEAKADDDDDDDDDEVLRRGPDAAGAAAAAAVPTAFGQARRVRASPTAKGRANAGVMRVNDQGQQVLSVGGGAMIGGGFEVPAVAKAMLSSVFDGTFAAKYIPSVKAGVVDGEGKPVKSDFLRTVYRAAYGATVKGKKMLSSVADTAMKTDSTDALTHFLIDATAVKNTDTSDISKYTWLHDPAGEVWRRNADGKLVNSEGNEANKSMAGVCTLFKGPKNCKNLTDAVFNGDLDSSIATLINDATGDPWVAAKDAAAKVNPVAIKNLLHKLGVKKHKVGGLYQPVSADRWLKQFKDDMKKKIEGTKLYGFVEGLIQFLVENPAVLNKHYRGTAKGNKAGEQGYLSMLNVDMERIPYGKAAQWENNLPLFAIERPNPNIELSVGPVSNIRIGQAGGDAAAASMQIGGDGKASMANMADSYRKMFDDIDAELRSSGLRMNSSDGAAIKNTVDKMRKNELNLTKIYNLLKQLNSIASSWGIVLDEDDGDFALSDIQSNAHMNRFVQSKVAALKSKWKQLAQNQVELMITSNRSAGRFAKRLSGKEVPMSD